MFRIFKYEDDLIAVVQQGNQQTAAIMEGDILTEKLPIADGPRWGVPEGVGLGVDVDMEQVEKYAALYHEHGQFLPHRPEMFEE